MDTHEQLVKKLMRRPGVKAEVERIEREEGALLDALLKARQDAGLTQAQVAERMGRSVDSVEKLWMRALGRLRKAFGEGT